MSGPALVQTSVPNGAPIGSDDAYEVDEDNALLVDAASGASDDAGTSEVCKFNGSFNRGRRYSRCGDTSSSSSVENR